jgi:hypothetical protein
MISKEQLDNSGNRLWRQVMKRLRALPKPVLVVALCCTLIAGGCTAQQIDAYINLAAQIALNALTIASAFASTPLSAHDAQLVTDFHNVLNNTVTSFTANRTAGNSVLVSIAEAAQSNIPQFLAAAQFDNQALALKITTAADSFLSIVESIAVLAQPGVVVPPAPAPVALKMGGVYRVPARVYRSRASIVTQWNEIVCQGTAAGCLVK